jgi:ATP-dependent DNA helicase PIF1
MSDKLNLQQENIFQKYKNRENVFITGPGGTGKTYLIKQIVKHAKENEKAFRVTALTGCAAILLESGATTLHAFSGIGLATGSMQQVVDRVVKNRYKKANWQKIELLIVDEVSMMSLKLLKILDKIGRKVKKEYTKPFGGIQVIFSGDFYQLPPVGDENDPETIQFCFETPLWDEIFPIENQIQLTSIFRQNDQQYVKILNGLRVGKITKNGISCLSNRVKEPVDINFKPTTILPKRRDADAINRRELDKLDNKTEKIYRTAPVLEEDLCLTKEQYQNLDLFTSKEREYEREYLIENIMAEREIKLRIGAMVMCVINLNIESDTPIINGSQGKIIDFVDKYPLIEFTNGSKQVISPHIWQSERLPGIAIKQLPLIYAWAITIHKAQGLTLEHAVMDIGANIFECGQTYVALSRVKSLEGLYLKSFDYNKIKINKKVQLYYNRLDII